MGGARRTTLNRYDELTMQNQANKSVVLGFSGGMDSVTAVGRLTAEGWRVVAVTLDTMGDEAMITKARRIAAELGVEHHVVDVRREFQREVIDYFIEEYAKGHTPAPCTVCNPAIKWRYLIQTADALGIEKVATGHYFRVEEDDGKYFVARATDQTKDQSYYLWNLSQDVLSRIVTPMSDMLKRDVRENFADKRESMGICFLRGVGYREFLVQHCPDVVRRGEIVDIEGRVVGYHDGIAFYTIGQKRGLEGVGDGRAVVGMDVPSNRLIVGTADMLYKSTLEIEDCNIVDKELFTTAADVSVVVRGIGRNPQGFIRRVEPQEGGYRIVLDDPAWAPAVGQPVVFYRKNRVLGGGFIARYF